MAHGIRLEYRLLHRGGGLTIPKGVLLLICLHGSVDGTKHECVEMSCEGSDWYYIPWLGGMVKNRVPRGYHEAGTPQQAPEGIWGLPAVEERLQS